eukprot:CAMPEP_0172783632 /NCGR_PEP_ID=MMETSP1074-20121228/204534_1 /TAXON_ID=2916 /ORGANISM="Ceratium fusus, Strain PA161109" /LENGTH=297 /DNA_ID=CAMNT_0013620627 /DNA_START=56 /DNA_END=949 /DNA_ORIENTATION=+
MSVSSVPSTCSDWPEVPVVGDNLNENGEPVDILRHHLDLCIPCNCTVNNRPCHKGVGRNCRRRSDGQERCHHEDHGSTKRPGRLERQRERIAKREREKEREAQILQNICHHGLANASFQDNAHGSASWLLASGYKAFIRSQTLEVQRDFQMLGHLWRRLENNDKLVFRQSEAKFVQKLACLAIGRGSFHVCSFCFTSFRDDPPSKTTVVGLPVDNWEKMCNMASEAYEHSNSSQVPGFISQQQAPNDLHDKDLFLTLGQGPEFFAVAHSNQLAHWYDEEKGYWVPYYAEEAKYSADA